MRLTIFFSRKTISAVFIAAGLSGLAPGQSLTSYVDPLIGTGGHGHTFPGAVMPFGMVQLSPDTRMDDWDGSSGYHYSDSVILGFSHTHLSGTGIPDLCDVLIAPSVGAVQLESGFGKGPSAGYASRFRHQNETASPGYYSVLLDDHNIRAELTATERSGFHRYSFPDSKESNLILDLTHRDMVLNSMIRIVNDSTIEGFRHSRSWANNQQIYFVMKFSQRFTSFGVKKHDVVDNKNYQHEGTNLKAWLRFETKKNKPLMVKVGISSVDFEGARNNLATEIPGWNFDNVKASAEAAWEKQLSKIRVSDIADLMTIGNPEPLKEKLTVFYTALYHTMIHPSLFSDADGRYRGRDNQVHQLPKGKRYYTIFSLWDTYRGLHPLFTLIEQERTREFIETFLLQYEQGKRLPVWELCANETDCMIGYHSVSVITDAWVKGIRGYDAAPLLRAMDYSATEDRFGIGKYMTKGYLAAEDESESVSKTLEYAYDDWCIAVMAQALGDTVKYAQYIRRAQGYRNLFDPATGFLRARRNGGWFTPFDPREVNFNFTEANAWQYSLSVPQDIPGLIRYMGGEAKFRAHLDALFSAESTTTGREQADITGLIGQYAHGNEPSHHIAYLYNFTSTPWKTRELTSRILHELYTSKPDGLSGNEDCGQMSAWYVLSALGFYPVTPGHPYYQAGLPLFRDVTLRFEDGHELRIRREDTSPPNPTMEKNPAYAEGKYLRGIVLGKNELSSPEIPHQQILTAGDLVFRTAREPENEKKWIPLTAPALPSCGEPNAMAPAPVIHARARAFTDTMTVYLQAIEPTTRAIQYIKDTRTSKQTAIFPDSVKGKSGKFRISSPSLVVARGVVPGCQEIKVSLADLFKAPKGIKLTLHTKYENQYSAGGDNALIDGLKGGTDFRTGEWQGYRENFEAVVDLGADALSKKWSEIQVGFLQDARAWIWVPKNISLEYSADGKTWTALTPSAFTPPDEKEMSPAVVRITADLKISGALRYLRVRGKQLGECPAWHPGAGGKTWIFADEISVK